MPAFGPIYCETFLAAQGAGFPVEYVNTVTSFIPAFLGILAFLWLYSHRSKQYELYALAVLTFATGLGSAFWHGLRTPLSLSLDVFPGLFYFLLFLFLWPYKLGGWLRGGLVFIGFFLVQVIAMNVLSLAESNGPPLSLFFVTTLFAFALLAWTHQKAGRVVRWGVAMIASALLAAIFRTLDLETCTFIPFGVHFLWHVFLGLAAYLGVRFLAALRETPSSGTRS